MHMPSTCGNVQRCLRVYPLGLTAHANIISVNSHQRQSFGKWCLYVQGIPLSTDRGLVSSTLTALKSPLDCNLSHHPALLCSFWTFPSFPASPAFPAFPTFPTPPCPPHLVLPIFPPVPASTQKPPASEDAAGGLPAAEPRGGRGGRFALRAAHAGALRGAGHRGGGASCVRSAAQKKGARSGELKRKTTIWGTRRDLWILQAGLS